MVFITGVTATTHTDSIMATATSVRAEALRMEAHRRKITVSELARRAGITREYASLVLHGHKKSPKALESMEAALAALDQEPASRRKAKNGEAR